ncbi:MAG: hypothetical protein H6994_11755 [Pseudomonadales bacterium]|nr:hypothetical protein [Pseudomonadales bacterium]
MTSSPRRRSLFAALILSLLVTPGWGADGRKPQKPQGGKTNNVTISAPQGARHQVIVNRQTADAYRQAAQNKNRARTELDATNQRIAALDSQISKASGDDRSQLQRQKERLQGQAAMQTVQLTEARRALDAAYRSVAGSFATAAAAPAGVARSSPSSASASTARGQPAQAGAASSAASTQTSQPTRVLQRTVRQRAGLVGSTGAPMPVAATQSRSATSSVLANARVVQANQRGPATPLPALTPPPGGRAAVVRLSPAQLIRNRSAQLSQLRNGATGIRAVPGQSLWSGKPGSVALDHQYSLEFLTPSHLYGRIAGDFHKAWSTLPTDQRPPFETWVTSAATPGANVPGQSAFDAVRAQHNGAYPTPVTYLTRDQSTGHELAVSGGQIGIRSGASLNRTTSGGQPQPVVFVVSEGGRVLAGNYERGKFHHSSLVGGRNVQGAGEMYFAPDGRLQAISDKSGHYMPDRVRLLQGLTALKNANVPLESVDLFINAQKQGISAGLFVRSENWRLDAANFGAVSRVDAESRLRGQPQGTWMLRQSANQDYGGVISRVMPTGRIEHTTLSSGMEEFKALAANNPQGTLLELARRNLQLQDNQMLKPAPDIPLAVGM